MNLTAAWVLLGLTLVLGLAPLMLTRRFRRELDALFADAPPVTRKPAALIVPCKGLDQGFEANVESFIRQDHPDLQIVFVVAEASDPAYPELVRLVADPRLARRGLRASVHVAGIDERRAQKLTNQLHGLRQVDASTEYLVFLDSDVRPDPGFVGRLVAPLEQPGVGATTGFRWYHPPRANLGSMLRSTWNAGALPLVTHPTTTFAFGGAMAITRRVFDEAGIGTAWDTALSDDFPFTLGVQRLGLELRFVPSCIAVSYETSTLAETLEFTNRQSIISRVYFPPLWWGAAVAHSLANVFLLFGLAGLAGWLATGGAAWAVLAGCLAIVPLQCLNAVAMLDAVPRLLPQLGAEFARLRPRYVAVAPLASVMSLLNTIYSTTTRQIVWRGIRYELVSPTETRVLPGR